MYELYVNGRLIETVDSWDDANQDAWNYRIRGLKVEIIRR